eukprot:g33035.t1
MTSAENALANSSAYLSSEAVREILGYLNFSNGKPDLGFQRNLNQLCGELPDDGQLDTLRETLLSGARELRKSTPAFADTTQAESALNLLVDHALPAYRRFHSDLLFHVDVAEFEQPFFIVKVLEAILAQGSPWNETDRIVDGAIQSLNDFVGVRPVAVLENDRPMEPYPHEKYRPIPLYLRDVGVAHGRYRELIERTIEFFAQVPDDLQRQAWFDLSRMDELAVDIRAYDHLHPVNKRTNYMFGEWDPHVIDIHGFYRRFILRRIILDSLLSWMDSYHRVSKDERLHDAAAVLCGTMLMASSISGAGPDTHDSSISLTTLLPHVALNRDMFYEYLLNQATGARATRLIKEAKSTQQPFGHVRKHLNIELAGYGARQVHCRFLTQFYAQMGSPEASRIQAAEIPSPAARFESEIGWRITAASRLLDRDELETACERIREVGGLLDRGIECGAIVDPWNILAFQGQFPLFQAREDAIPDQRIDLLLDFLERYFAVFSQTMSEAAARGEAELTHQLSQEFRERAEWWDRFATTVVDDLPKVKGVEMWQSAERVSEALSQWRKAGESAGDISFWRQHVDQFESPAAYGQVVTTLLDKGDHVAAMGLLMQWLSQAEEVGLETGEYSFNDLIVRWMKLITEGTGTARLKGAEAWKTVRRLFDYLEANAGSFWSVPEFDLEGHSSKSNGPDEVPPDDENFNEDEFWQADESDLYSAAYDDVSYRDSTDDGNVGDTLDDGYRSQSSEIELTVRALEPRLAFLRAMADLWETAGKHLLSKSSVFKSRSAGDIETADSARQIVDSWRSRLRTLERGLASLLVTVSDYEIDPPSGDFESNFEYDLQTQSRFSLQHHIVDTILSCRTAGWTLHACSPSWDDTGKTSEARRRISDVLAMVYQRDVVSIRRKLPEFIEWLSLQPLLYIPLENDGEPKRFLAIRTLQSVLRILLVELAQLGLLDEVWQVLQTAHSMERSHRPEGMATTEFDQLFKLALKSSLECLIRAADCLPPVNHYGRPAPGYQRRKNSYGPAVGLSKRRSQDRRVRDGLGVGRRETSPRVSHSRQATDTITRTMNASTFHGVDRSAALIEAVGFIVDQYHELWQKYSRSIRITSVEALHQDDLWKRLKKFIERFGDDFFQTPMLMVSNIRSILHVGVDSYLDYLAEEEDPLKPNRLLEALDEGEIDHDDACHYLELVYECILDKLERFIEYNTTTTQSDYGHQLYCLLDFLRAESEYDRDAWILKPYWFAHEVLTETGHTTAALRWEEVLRERSGPKAEKHLRKLRRLEKTYGVCLPSLADRLGERFVKSLAVNRMIALIPQALSQLRTGGPSDAFAQLQSEIHQYLETTAGSAIEVPDWLARLDREGQRADEKLSRPGDTKEPAATTLRPRQLARRLESWPKSIPPKM